jgi:hypothetical protein
MYDNHFATPIFCDARTLGEMSKSGGRWYTDPDKTGSAGHLYKSLLEDRRKSPESKKPLFIVQVAQDESSSFRSERDEWEEKSIDRETAGTLTDFAVMAKMGLIDVKIVSIPDQWDPEEWRNWITGEGLRASNDVQADLKVIVESVQSSHIQEQLTSSRLKPGVPRRSYEKSRSYTYVKDMLTTIELFVGVAFRKHGLQQ